MVAFSLLSVLLAGQVPASSEVRAQWLLLTAGGDRPLKGASQLLPLLAPIARRSDELGLYRKASLRVVRDVLAAAKLGEDAPEVDIDVPHFGDLAQNAALVNIWYLPDGPGQGFRANVLFEGSEVHLLGARAAFGSLLVGRALKWGNRITLYGQYENGGNSPCGGLEVWSKTDGTWMLRQAAHTYRESWDSDPVHTASHRRIALRTRDYPKHLAVPHAGPQLTFDYVWTLEGGRYVGRESPRPSPLRSLDGLVKATKDGDERRMREYLPTYHLRRIWRERWPLIEKDGFGVSTLGSQVADEDPHLVFSRSGVVVRWTRRTNRFVVSQLGRVPPQ